MRVKGIAIVGLAFVASAIFLLARPSLPNATFTFVGYDTSGWATFTLTNHTQHYLDHSHLRIQARTHGCWTDYSGAEMGMCRLIGPLPAHSASKLSASLPIGFESFRAAVDFRVVSVYGPGWRATLGSVLAVIGLGPQTNELTLATPEFVR
jgi:hypothetical protein